MSGESRTKKPGVVWMKTRWKFRHNPFPAAGIARLGGTDNRENGLLFRPEVQQEKVQEAIEKFVLGATYSGMKFGYLWSIGRAGEFGLGDVRGFGKSSMLQYLVEEINVDFGKRFIVDSGLDETDAAENPLCAVLSSFDMANARSLAAVFFEATRYACRFRRGSDPTLASRLHAALISRVGSSKQAKLKAAVIEVADGTVGRTLGPPIDEFIDLLCEGDATKLGRFVESVKSGARGRVAAANYLATLLFFAKAAGINHVLLGCDQLEDFAATSTTRQKRALEVERFRDYVMELQPMADMLTVVVTLHPRAEEAIGEMWRLADLPSLAPGRPENESRIVVLEAIEGVDRAKALLAPYLADARTEEAPAGTEFAPFTPDAIELLLSRSDGKPRDLLRKAAALIEEAAKRNWEEIDSRSAASILDTLSFEDEGADLAAASKGSIEEIWTT
jgi:hypothetical protein